MLCAFKSTTCRGTREPPSRPRALRDTISTLISRTRKFADLIEMDRNVCIISIDLIRTSGRVHTRECRESRDTRVCAAAAPRGHNVLYEA